MEEYQDLKFINDAQDSSEALRMYKSQLYQMAKCAQKIFESLNSGDEIEEWMKKSILSAYDGLEKVSSYIDYNASFPKVKDPLEPLQDDPKESNNYLTNDDKRFPVPQEAEGGDEFVGRCISDPAMKARYPQQSDRFMACLLIYNQDIDNAANNPGTQFDDPMQPTETPPIEPDKPILP
tara:strand:- start:21599 stop:22135 length:537 start_codon:yes stop_codon:yes gene_type:complete